MRPTLIMGVVNVTPDSFSDGGLWLDPGAAVAHAEKLVADGAAVIDLGAESTRPGAKAVDEAEEWRRLEPVLKALSTKRRGALLSVDTRKPALMLRAAEAGAHIINSVGGVPDQPTLDRLGRFPGLQFVAMHMHGTPETMQKEPLDQPVEAVDRFFADASRRLEAAGFAPDRIWLDPGIGFGKTDRGNARLLAGVKSWAERYQIAVGVSRKSFLGRTLGLSDPMERDAPSKALELGLALLGARMIRTHDVRRLKALLDLLDGAA